MKIYSQPYSRRTHRLSITLARENDRFRLKVETLKDAPGTLYRLCAVLFRHDWDIQSAEICSHVQDHQVIDEFVVRPLVDVADLVDEIKFEAMMTDFEKLLFEELEVNQYLAKHPLPQPATGATSPASVQVQYENDGARTYLILSGPDCPGLLLMITGVFAGHDVDLLEAHIETSEDQSVRNRFLVNPTDQRFADPEFRESLARAIARATAR